MTPRRSSLLACNSPPVLSPLSIASTYSLGNRKTSRCTSGLAAWNTGRPPKIAGSDQQTAKFASARLLAIYSGVFGPLEITIQFVIWSDPKGFRCPGLDFVRTSAAELLFSTSLKHGHPAAERIMRDSPTTVIKNGRLMLVDLDPEIFFDRPDHSPVYTLSCHPPSASHPVYPTQIRIVKRHPDISAIIDGNQTAISATECSYS